MPVGSAYFGPAIGVARDVEASPYVDPLCGWSVLTVTVVEPLADQPSLDADSKVGLPIRLCPSITVTCRSSR